MLVTGRLGDSTVLIHSESQDPFRLTSLSSVTIYMSTFHFINDHRAVESVFNVIFGHKVFVDLTRCFKGNVEVHLPVVVGD